MKVKAKIEALLGELNTDIFEKEKIISLTLLSSIAGESIFLLGAPGVAKSLVARRLKYAYKDGTTFEYLMNRFSTPDEIFGPVSISQLKDHDKYERIVKNYLPTASVVFLDEIWKAGPSIQNALLTVLNEKIYRNGEQEIKVPMKALISASNELPGKGQGLEALWDRFLIRLIVEGVQKKENFNEMISKSKDLFKDAVNSKNKITDEEYLSWYKEIDDIEIPENVFEVIHVIRGYIDQHNKKEQNKEKQIYISDRRWCKIVRLLKTSAFLNDRKSVDLMDCFLIKYCLWNETDQSINATQFVTDAIQKHGYTLSMSFTEINEELKDLKIEIKEETKFEKDTRIEVLVNARSDYYEILGISSDRNLIQQTDFNALSNKNESEYLFYWYESYNRVQRYSSFNIRKGNSKFSLFVNDKEYQLKTRIDGEKRLTTKKPHKKVEEEWDSRIEKYLGSTSSLKSQLDDYREKDLHNLRVNLFVHPELANVVESHIMTTKKEIEKIEVEIRKIQNDYKILKDEEKVIKQ